MSVEFKAQRQISNQLKAELEDFAPANPFYTSAYMDYKTAIGFEPLTFLVREDRRILSACPAFKKSGRLNKLIEIPSLPDVTQKDTFWQGLRRFCREEGITQLEINSFASSKVDIPAWPNEVGRKTRCEYVLDLQQENLWENLSSNHKRNIKRGQKAGLKISRSADVASCHAHVRMLEASTARRKNRGEMLSDKIIIPKYMASVQSGAGALFQAFLNGKVLSSILVLCASKGAYYQSAGTSNDGMKCGASHFLVYSVSKFLKEESMEMFNLGGAEQDNAGLIRFKAGFGATPVNLEAVVIYLATTLRKTLTKLAHFV